MAESSNPARPLKPMQVLSLGCCRTGSTSITKALEILGYQNVHHGIKAIRASQREWALFSAAADACFPSLPGHIGAKPFTRADWDALFGRYEAVTDMGSFFAVPLARAYPYARVILVEREIESWYASMDAAIFSTTWGAQGNLFARWLAPLWGLRGGLTIQKILLGFFEARNVAEVRAHARDRYRRHYAEVRAAVEPERLLDYKIEDGWGPLCAFLGKEVPRVPFPKENSRAEHLNRIKKGRMAFLKIVIKTILRRAAPWVLAAAAAASLGYWVYQRPDAVVEAVDFVKSKYSSLY